MYPIKDLGLLWGNVSFHFDIGGDGFHIIMVFEFPDIVLLHTLSLSLTVTDFKQ